MNRAKIAKQKENKARLTFQLAQLRHAYKQLKDGAVKDQAAFADGLLSPAIKVIEDILSND